MDRRGRCDLKALDDPEKAVARRRERTCQVDYLPVFGLRCADGARVERVWRSQIMSNIQATLHLMCGKICAGKSTLAMRLATTPNTIIVSEDHWLSRLYPDEIVALPDYIRCASRLRAAMGPH